MDLKAPEGAFIAVFYDDEGAPIDVQRIDGKKVEKRRDNKEELANNPVNFEKVCRVETTTLLFQGGSCTGPCWVQGSNGRCYYIC
jgi:hypothetical protein